ncbi:competence protein ComEA [Parabacteroides sp. PFB2-10]|uniref:ComEA family DNA-binding protein n=1 Tax=Parabacteroides sp. PFB2-10 TaxID=1742405 RepID=UPI002475C503|nr:helix-hairpin-helix domain-containing protein [Parabacteroides sp. PFB2-10]MDH6312506.1 competence protein ComEA [Parabacteroides sp. PFB2-10]MDL2244420.1 helix-hairpin-helix domain-containing protein [Parabacteroides sp. OttesenSCG-928-J18]
MSWKDFFYFSKGERLAIGLLLLIISLSLLIQLIRGYDRGGKETALYPVTIYSPNAPQLPPHVTTLPPAKNLPAKPLESTFSRSSTEKKIPENSYRTNKYPVGTVVELNTADTTILKRVPGIGSVFANRIVRYRNLLGGFYCVEQLGEVYGIDADRYEALKDWFCVNPERVRMLPVNLLPLDSLLRHPYIDYPQARVIKQLVRQKGRLTGWNNLQLLEEFTENDRKRMLPYLSFE